jgi:hypothetical protein
MSLLLLLMRVYASAAYNNNYAKGKCPSGSYSKASYLSAKVTVNVHYVIVLTGGVSNATGGWLGVILELTLLLLLHGQHTCSW